MPHYRALACLLAVTTIVIATVLVSTQPQVLAITAVSVIDVVDGRIVPDSTVVVTGDTITSVTQNGAPPGDAQRIDGRDKFLIPGLWDMHAHIQGNEQAWLPLYIANGVTGIRDMGADLDFILAIKEASASGRILGPRIVTAGPILDDAPGDWPLRIRVRNPDEGRAAVQLLKRRGVDLIKVHNFTPREVFFAIVEEARREQLPVAGHMPAFFRNACAPPGLANTHARCLVRDRRDRNGCFVDQPRPPRLCEQAFPRDARRESELLRQAA
jgi:hypothetical protein